MLLMYLAMIEDEADAVCFEDIYYNYRQQMYSVAEDILSDPYEAEDAVQDALLRLARSIKAVPRGKPPILRTYVLTAAKNAALRRLKQKKRAEEAISLHDLKLAAEENLFEKIVNAENHTLLMRAIRQLESPYWEILTMMYVHSRTSREIADILGRKEATVCQQLKRGRKLLIKLCEKEGMCFED